MFAPFDGVIVSAKNSTADNAPMVDTNEEEPLGNHVIIEHENNEYSVIAHMQEGSLLVEEGDSSKRRRHSRLAGNSGNSSEPHIHFHVANGSDWENAASITENGDDKMDAA